MDKRLWHDRFVTSVDGHHLRSRFYGNPRQIDFCLVFFSGRNEWIEKYAYLPGDLGLESKVGFLTFDHRGQGASSGTRAHIDHYDSFVSDAKHVLEYWLGDKPYAIMAHSMGSLIALYGTLRGVYKPQSLLLASPFLGVPLGWMPRKPVRSLLSALNGLGLGRLNWFSPPPEEADFESNRLTHSKRRFETMTHAPFPSKSPTLAWIQASFAAIDLVHDESLLLRLPANIHVLAASHERVVDPEAIEAWIQLASESGVSVHYEVIPATLHELFAEKPKAYHLALQRVREWLAGLE